MSLGDSILQTASIARCVSVAVTANDHTIFNPSLQAEVRQQETTVESHPSKNEGGPAWPVCVACKIK